MGKQQEEKIKGEDMKKNLKNVPAKQQAGKPASQQASKPEDVNEQNFPGTKDVARELKRSIDVHDKVDSEEYNEGVDYEHEDNGQKIIPGYGVESQSAQRLKDKMDAHREHSKHIDTLLKNTEPWHFYAIHALSYFLDALVWLEKENDGFGRIAFSSNHLSTQNTDKVSIKGAFQNKNNDEMLSKKYLFYQEKIPKVLVQEEISDLADRKAKDLLKITMWVERTIKNNTTQTVFLMKSVCKFTDIIIY